MFPYIPSTDIERQEMMDFIGIKSMEDLFSYIPEELRLKRELDLEKGLSELELSKEIKDLADKNINMDEVVSFLGAGSYDHYIPSVVKHITSRSEFYTAYTPYQAEISQGTLQSIFEFQTMICSLTGMEVSNSSMYDGPTAAAEACIMASASTRRKNIIISSTVNPETRKVLKTYGRFRGLNIIEAESEDGVLGIEKLKKLVDKDTAAVLIQSPNFFGIIEDGEDAAKIAHDNKALLIMSVDPISLGILKSPGEMGADIVVGEGQALGANLNFGGPNIGFLTTTSKLMRKMPGRIVGETCDVDGKRGFVLTLQAREQHIRREKATSNICSDQTLNTIGAAVYLSTLGKEGIKEVALNSAKKAHYTFEQLTKSGKFKPLFNKPFFKEFAITSNLNAEQINEELLCNGILGGYILEKEYPQYKNSMLLCVTEKRTKEEIDRLVNIMEVI